MEEQGLGGFNGNILAHTAHIVDSILALVSTGKLCGTLQYRIPINYFVLLSVIPKINHKDMTYIMCLGLYLKIFIVNKLEKVFANKNERPG